MSWMKVLGASVLLQLVLHGFQFRRLALLLRHRRLDDDDLLLIILEAVAELERGERRGNTADGHGVAYSSTGLPFNKREAVFTADRSQDASIKSRARSEVNVLRKT